MTPRILVDGTPIATQAGDCVAVALARIGEHPTQGGTLCLAGDCGACVAEVDGISWVRTCQTPVRAGMVVKRHPAVGSPSAFASPASGPQVAEDSPVDHRHVDVVVIGARSTTGAAEVASLQASGREVLALDGKDGHEVVAIYAGPRVIARTAAGIMHVHAHEVVVATGAAELQPVVPGNDLQGLLTVKAAEALVASGIDLGNAISIGPIRPRGVHCNFLEGTLEAIFPAAGENEASAPNRRVGMIQVRALDGESSMHACNTLILGLGTTPRDVLSRMADDPAVRVIGPAGEKHALPSCPTEGLACPCSKITVEDWHGAWDRGFTELELMKRSSLTGTGTCQGSVCLPHLQAFISAQRNDGSIDEPFTARPATRQITLAEASSGIYLDAWRRTPLHEEHLKLGANMDRFGGWWRPWNYGDHVAEYWAVREGVSIGDVSTLGKMIIQGPDAIEVLERLYPTTIADIKPGRSRYVLILNERGHLFDDGMVCRETEDRFVLTFTSGGASSAEAWVRDWVDTWGLEVRLIDRTHALAAINVTGPLGGELLKRLGVAEPPKFLQHRHQDVAGVPCHIMRLSFTGEASWELHHPWDRSAELWRALMEAGRDMGIKPHGLQALFGLRLEKGHILVGMDTEMDTTPKRIQHDWAVKMQKPFFLGQEALARTASLPNSRRLIGLTMDGPAPIEGIPILAAADYAGAVTGDILGHVATSFYSPLLKHTIALGWLKRGWSEDQPLMETVQVDGRVATLAEPPFYDKEGKRARA